MTDVRIFNLNGITYKYNEDWNYTEQTRTKTLSLLTKNSEGKDEFVPIIKKSKYSENAYSYENFKTGEVILADNFRTNKEFDVFQRFSKDIWENEQIGKIRGNVITTNSLSKTAIRALRRIKTMLTSF